MAPPAEAVAASLPAWRVELNEKVRAIRANRGASPATSETAAEELATTAENDPRPAGVSARNSYDMSSTAHVTAPRPEPTQQATVSGRRSSNNIVEAALTRVKRASENASRAALPKIEPARSIQPTTQGSLAVDRQATARALEPVREVEPTLEYRPAPRPEAVQPQVISHAPVIVQPPVLKARIEAAASPEPDISETPVKEVAEPAPVLILDEIEPLDYLEAEVRKVDKALGAEFLRNESPSIVTHAVIGLIDLIAVAVSCSPFLAIILIADGSFGIGQTQLAAGGIVALIAFFYLVLTQCLCGRTFGMMVTNTRVVDSQTFEAPSPSQALLRTVGYFVAVAPAFVGILWAAFDHKRRGWQDFVSRTLVVRDF